MSDIKNIKPIIFPFHLGNSIQDITPALLYNESVSVMLPAFVMNDPIDAFINVCNRAAEKKHVLLPTLDSIYNAFNSAQEVAYKYMQFMKPLKGRVDNILYVHPGTIDTYSSLEAINIPNNIINKLNDLLDIPEYMHFTAIEFIFRIYELTLELSGNPDIILEYLKNRVDYLGSPDKLLIECAINRITTSGAGTIPNAIINCDVTMELLSYYGKPLTKEVDTTEIRIDILSAYMFKTLIEQYSPRITPTNVNKIIDIFSSRKQELESMRKKCTYESVKLINSAVSETTLKYAINESLATMKEEVSSIAKIDSKSLKMLYNKLTEDPVNWITISGLIGTSVSHVPPSVSATLAITLFSRIGASALSSSRAVKDTLKKSPWSLVHYLNAFR
ncbi:hypothetical protein GKZ28_06635 [Clostridium chromiireducens]|uniref:Uncharacterized protein n=1 Tax=Clostridium chromiireducens TaxID=225345 RepID=A0A964RKH3_9CLOT|nr:hypothetical protein [Clostridium chromiireducens]MVX63372.1 hypothetical protein [Clostridium chromiireducens]